MFRALRVRNYRLYASGQLVSLTGTWMQRVAQDWLVLELTNSGTALGIITALQFGPALLLGPLGGLLADRADKRRTLIITQSSLAVLALVLGILDLSGVVAYWQVLILATLTGVVTAIDTPVRQSFVVEMVGKDDLTNAVAINSTIFNAARILGPALAAVVIAVVGTGWSFIGNSASGIAVIAGLALMRTAELHTPPIVERAKGQLIEGVRYVRGRSDLMLAIAMVFVVGTFGMNFQITTAVMAKQVFDRGAGGYGALSTSLAVGACIGAVLATRRTTRPTQLLLIVTALIFAVLEIAAGLMPTFIATAIMLVPTGLVMMSFTTAANACVQLGVAPTMRGRVMAIYLMAFMGGTLPGAPIVGWISTEIGPRWGMIGGGLITLVFTSVLALLIARRRELGPAYLAERLQSAAGLERV
jgi:MFS family permease